jgi:hypothetical protein
MVAHRQGEIRSCGNPVGVEKQSPNDQCSLYTMSGRPFARLTVSKNVGLNIMSEVDAGKAYVEFNAPFPDGSGESHYVLWVQNLAGISFQV